MLRLFSTLPKTGIEQKQEISSKELKDIEEQRLRNRAGDSPPGKRSLYQRESGFRVWLQKRTAVKQFRAYSRVPAYGS